MEKNRPRWSSGDYFLKNNHPPSVATEHAGCCHHFRKDEVRAGFLLTDQGKRQALLTALGSGIHQPIWNRALWKQGSRARRQELRLGMERPGFYIGLCHYPAPWPWAKHFFCVSLLHTLSVVFRPDGPTILQVCKPDTLPECHPELPDLLLFLPPALFAAMFPPLSASCHTWRLPVPFVTCMPKGGHLWFRPINLVGQDHLFGLACTQCLQA